MRSPPVHCASHKCIGHCADFRALPVAMLPALVQALLRSPPALRPALPRAVRSAPPATQSPWRLHRASRDGVDSPIAHTAGFTDLTARGGLGSHTPRIGDAGRAMEPYVLPFRRHSGSIGVVRLLDRAYVGPKLADDHRPVPARPRLSCRGTRGCPERNTSETRATCACCGRGGTTGIPCPSPELVRNARDFGMCGRDAAIRAPVAFSQRRPGAAIAGRPVPLRPACPTLSRALRGPSRRAFRSPGTRCSGTSAR